MATTDPVATLLNPAEVTPISLDARLREVESQLITWALHVSGGNKSRAADLLRLKRSTLCDRINRCGLGRESSAPVAGESAFERRA